MRPAPEDYTWVLETTGLADVILNTKDEPPETRIKLGDRIVTLQDARAQFAGCPPDEMTRPPEDWTMVAEINGIENVVRSTHDYPQHALIILDDEVYILRQLRASAAIYRRHRRHGPKR